MIEILLKNKELLYPGNITEIPVSNLEFQLMRFTEYADAELNWLSENYGLDFTIMKNHQDIEISSHFLESESQVAFHFSIPYFNKEEKMEEEQVFIICSKTGIFMFTNPELDGFFNSTYSYQVNSIQKIANAESLFKFQFEFIADYLADITERLTKKIKLLANKILIEKSFSNEELDIITRYNFSNLLIKETLLETTRIFNLYLKSYWEASTGIKQCVQAELNDLATVSDYIQFNFDRLDDLKENVSNKIDLEQNYIFKMLTIVTVCISLPTFIAGIYGMNFKDMPELELDYGYPIVIIVMLLSALLPFIYFKKKSWLK
ncbi:magnesium transporter [Echinicola soli]|uniref:Magnesium transporter n=1 Tax=Echinicola soli TaxID=2591634 RepID=A0A514CFI6_9BACT|nr:CorA family divalent cation transporter [Echinicola soli]QDH78566.1 magnesium transporter [Echinicola soli]